MFFKNCLQSLANQTDKRFHVYIGDDASPEDPIDIIEDYKGQIELTYKKFSENIGGLSLVKQWERCINLTKGEKWVTILGDDDVYDTAVVENFYTNLEKIKREGLKVVRFATYVLNDENKIIGSLYHHPEKELAADFLIRKFREGTRSTLSEYFFKTDVVRRVKFKDFPLAWTSDTLGVVEFSEDNYIYTINTAAIGFRISEYNITGQGDSVQKNEAWFRFYEYLIKNYGKQYPLELLDMLLDRLEKVQLNNKKTPLRWCKMIYLYCKTNQFSRLFTIGTKIIKSIQ
tara:strand:+ start:120 stop:980 length:861 start_codon:yes stop_codon:yes gene_type:complete